MIRSHALLGLAFVFDAKTFAILAVDVGMFLAGFVSNAVDGLAEILRRVGTIWLVTQEVASTVSISSTGDINAGVILASFLGAASVMSTAVDWVASILLFDSWSGVFIVASPGFSTFLSFAIFICSTLDAHASFVLTFRFCPTLSMVSAGFDAVNFVVALESWVVEGIVVAEAAIGTVCMLSAFLFFAFSADALADSILASLREVVLAGQMSETLMTDAFVFDAELVRQAVFFADAADGGADVLGASLRAGRLVAVIVFRAVNEGAFVVLADVLLWAVLSESTFGWFAFVFRTDFDWVSRILSFLTVIVAGTVDLGADFFFRLIVDRANMLSQVDVLTIRSSSARRGSELLSDENFEVAAVSFGVGGKCYGSSLRKGVPSMVPSF